MQDIDAPGEFGKLVVTFLVMRAFSNFPGASRACADFRDPTAVSRIIAAITFMPIAGFASTSRRSQKRVDNLLKRGIPWHRHMTCGHKERKALGVL